MQTSVIFDSKTVGKHSDIVIVFNALVIAVSSMNIDPFEKLARRMEYRKFRRMSFSHPFAKHDIITSEHIKYEVRLKRNGIGCPV